MIWEYETLETSQLKPASYNPREISKDEFEGLKQSLKTFGFADPAVVNSNNNVIVGGHQRIKAWEALGNNEVPCMLAPLTDKQEKKLNVLLNSQAISGRYDDLMLSELLEGMKLDDDYESLRLDQLEPLDLSDTEVEEDEAPEVSSEPPVSQLGSIYQLGRHRVMCGDSTDKASVELLMDGVKADMVFTDPPYGISIVQNNQVGGGGAFGVGKEAKKKGKFIKANKHKEVIGDDTIDVAVSAIKIIKELDIKTQIIWGGNYYANHLDNSNCWIVWDKQTGDSTFADAELAWTNQETKVRVFQHRWSGMVKASEHGEKRVHPTQKPIALALWCFEHYGEKDKGVLDLFGGSGSTLIACEQTDRICYGMELDPKYVDVIRKRYAKFVYPDRWEEEWESLTKEVA